MFSARLSAVSVVVFALLAAATNIPTTTVTVTAPGPTTTSIPASQCNTSDLQCCNSVQSAGSAGGAALLALLGVAVQNLTVLVGSTCSPINVLGIGSGGACTAQPVCCSNNNFHGIIAIGCTPINVGL